jgi:peroxiredoxin
MTRATIVLAFAAVCAACHSSPPTPSTTATDSNAPANVGAQTAPSQKAKVGEAAPDFSLKDTEGKTFQLSDLRGKVVVLEWFNPGCPFVRRNHTKGPLKDMARDVTANGVTIGGANVPVVWLAVNSGAPGKQGAGAESSRAGKEQYGMTNPVLLDENGVVGRAYGAKSTPHMFVIDPSGKLVYAGAIDNAQDGDTPNGEPFVNYVDAALKDLSDGRPVKIAQTESYGCSVKYAQ